MQLGTIKDPFSGEKLADVFPPLTPFVSQDPRLSRLHYFPGRHLTKDHLQAEQAIRVRRLELRGRSVSAGVITGLEVAWRDTADGIEFQLQPGHALTHAGTDIVVDRTVATRLIDLPLLSPDGSALAAPPESAHAAILVLRPGFALDAGIPLAAQFASDLNTSATDFTPCPRVPEDEVYYKTTRTDAAQLALVVLPDNEPMGTTAESQLTWRSRLAWHLFGLEAKNLPQPWLALGLPLAVVGFDDSLRPLFIDRHSVVRPGGRPRQRNLAFPDLDPRAWQARFDQFCSQLSELTNPDAAETNFQFLPPVGLLPKTYLDLAAQPGNLTLPANFFTLPENTPDPRTPPRWLPTQSFFPNGYTVDVSVVPTEQLDALIADHRSLTPYSLNHLDAVRILLPVSQQWFDPDLLKIEYIDLAYDRAIARFKNTRGDWLARRLDLARRRNALTLASNNTSVDYPPNPDPKQLETPETPISAPPGDAIQFATTRNTSTNPPTYTSNTLTALRTKAATLAGKFKFNTEDFAEFKELFKACGLTAAQITAAFAIAPASPAPSWLTATPLETPAGEKPLDPDDQNELRRELLAYIKKQTEIQTAEATYASSASIQGLIDSFTEKTEEADDLVDSGFLKVRTDVFRLGHLLNNNSLGTKFTASPSLATIIDRKPPKADSVAVNAFASQLLANFAPSATQSIAAANTVNAANNAGGLFPLMMMKSAPINFTVGADMNNKVSGFQTPSFIIDEAKYTSARNKITDPDELKVLDDAKLAADFINSSQFTDLIGEAKTLNTFASGYVENFNLLSQKQIRAIPLDRLQPPLAPKVSEEIHDGRLEIFERLTRLNISLGDLTTDYVDAPGKVVRPTVITENTKLLRLRFQSLIARRSKPLSVKITTTETSTTKSTFIDDADESKHFSQGVSFADMAMAALRAVEKRIKDYRAFVDECRAAQKEIAAQVAAINTTLPSVEHELDEARQDVSVAQALKAEEQARLDDINAHRAKILREHVEFLVFHRPRAVTAVTEIAARPLEDALLTDPILECFTLNPTPPADLAALRDPFRGSPASWFIHAPKWIEKVDRWEHLRALLERSTRLSTFSVDTAVNLSSGRYQAALGTLIKTRQIASQKHLAVARQIAPAALAAFSWIDLKREAETKLTLGHLIEAGPASLAKIAAEELDRMFIVATCLHENFSQVPGLIRLAWTERFSQFDNVNVDFRDLSRLPNWNRIDFNLRRESQIFADWLYGRINQNIPEALDLIHDLIRVALLLASHAPVDQLVIGQPIEDKITPVVGGIIKLKVDPMRIRRGMEVTHQISATQILKATVEDITTNHVSARILQVPANLTAPLSLNSSFYFR